MSSDYFANKHPDLTMTHAIRGEGMNMGLLYFCGHRASRAGGLFKKVTGQQPIAWKCALCREPK